MAEDSPDTPTASSIENIAATELPRSHGDGDHDAPTRGERLVTTLRDGSRDGTVALVGGLAALFVAVRSRSRGRIRAIATALTGVGLIGHGLRKRRRARDADVAFDRVTTPRQKPSDDAHAATVRQGHEDPFDAEDEPAGDEATDDVEFTTDPDEPAPKPGLEDETSGDPRRRTDDEAEVDLSESATAAEESEAAGPDPAQAQPAQTDPTEPEADPDADVGHEGVDELENHAELDEDGKADEDASHKRVESDDEEA